MVKMNFFTLQNLPLKKTGEKYTNVIRAENFWMEYP